MHVGATEPSAVDDSATSKRSRLKSNCCRSDCVGVHGHSTTPPANAAHIRQPRLPRRQDIWRSQREKPLSSVFGNKLCYVLETNWKPLLASFSMEAEYRKAALVTIYDCWIFG